ncbi:MAG: FliH/SctL family protein [Vulcanimicrobiaceae bacterium]
MREPRVQPERDAEVPHAALVQELTLLRLAALEAYERARSRLLESLARDVLARELLLAPAEIEVLARRALAAFAEAEPLGLALAPQDAERVALTLPVRADPALEPGDLVVEVRDGELESRFAFRVRLALEDAAGDA